MAIDFQVVYPAEVLALTAARQVSRTPRRVLEISGYDFRSVDEVLLNEVPSQEVIIVSQTKLLAQVPETLGREDITSISVLSRRITISPKSLIRFRIGNRAGKVRGVLRLVQLYLKVLLSTPGFDIFAKQQGGGLLKNLGGTFSKGNVVVSDVVLSVDSTNRQLLSAQARDGTIPFDERLLNGKLISARFDAEDSALLIALEIVSQAGEVATANLIA